MWGIISKSVRGTFKTLASIVWCQDSGVVSLFRYFLCTGKPPITCSAGPPRHRAYKCRCVHQSILHRVWQAAALEWASLEEGSESITVTMSGRRRDYHALRQELVRANSLYVDPDFPPDFSSLTFTGTPPPGLRTVIWKRPTVSVLPCYCGYISIIFKDKSIILIFHLNWNKKNLVRIETVLLLNTC